MNNSPEIILYDIPVRSGDPKRQALSYNPYKTRLALNYKGIPYRTIWADYGDIQAVCKSIGATTDEKRPSGEPRYTFPTIIVPATGEVISDSAKIIEYLERKYPDKPLIPAGKVKEQVGYEGEFHAAVGMDRALIVILRAYRQMYPASGAAMERTIREFLGTPPFADMPLPNRENFLRVEKGLSALAATYKGKYVEGEEVTYKDMIVAANLITFVRMLDEEEKALLWGWDGGRWGKMLDEFEEKGWFREDEGEVFTP